VHSKVIVERLCGKLEEPEMVKVELKTVSIKPSSFDRKEYDHK
jgi:hypothetical protein